MPFRFEPLRTQPLAAAPGVKASRRHILVASRPRTEELLRPACNSLHCQIRYGTI